MRTDCLLPLPTLTFLTLLLAALFARDRLHEAFLDTARPRGLSTSRFFFSTLRAVSLRDLVGVTRGLSSASIPSESPLYSQCIVYAPIYLLSLCLFVLIYSISCRQM